jgi:hypothetical protein
MQQRLVMSTKAISSLKVFVMLIYQRSLMNQIIRCCCVWKYLASLYYLRNEFLKMIKYFRAMTHDEEKYPSPNEFKPERFLHEDGSLTDDTMQLSFGWGRRIW